MKVEAEVEVDDRAITEDMKKDIRRSGDMLVRDLEGYIFDEGDVRSVEIACVENGVLYTYPSKEE